MTAENETNMPESGTIEEPATGAEEQSNVEAADAMADPAVSKKSKERHTKRARRKKKATLGQVVARFAACGRCSFFLTSYRAEQSLEALQTAVEQAQSGWLVLNWDHNMRNLVHKSYGVRLDIAYDYYESCCVECRRRFVFQAPVDEEQQAGFLIEI